MPNYNYICESCNFTSKIKTNYLSHLKTKKHLKNIKNQCLGTEKKNNISSQTLTNPHNLRKFLGNLDFSSHPDFNSYSEPQAIPELNNLFNHDTNKFSCPYCNKSFSRQDNLKRHLENWCKEKTINQESTIFKNLYEKELLEKEKQKEEHQKQVEMLLDKVGNTTINNNNNCGNTQNNTQNNVQLNNFGQENLDMLTDKYMRKMVIYPYTAIPKMIKKIHFNDNFPENKNIRMLNKKDNKLQIRTNDKWEYVNKKETLETLISDKNYQLDKYYEDNKDQFDSIKQNRFEGFQDKIGDNDKHVNKEIDTGTELIFWNSM